MIFFSEEKVSFIFFIKKQISVSYFACDAMFSAYSKSWNALIDSFFNLNTFWFFIICSLIIIFVYQFFIVEKFNKNSQFSFFFFRIWFFMLTQIFIFTYIFFFYIIFISSKTKNIYYKDYSGYQYINFYLNETEMFNFSYYSIFSNFIFFISFFFFFCSKNINFFFNSNFKQTGLVFYQKFIIEIYPFFYLILAFIALSFMLCSNSFISFYVCLELFSIAMYFSISSVAIFIKDKIFIEIAIKYFSISIFGSAILLLGIFFFFYFFGTLNFSILNYYFFSSFNGIFYFTGFGFKFAIFFFFIGFFIKFGIAPFHFWINGVYDKFGSTLFQFTLLYPKVYLIFFMINFFFFSTKIGYVCLHYVEISNFFIFISVSNIFFGAFSAIFNANFKKIFIFSSLTNIGYVLFLFSTELEFSVPIIWTYLISYFVVIQLIFFFFDKINYYSADTTIKNWQFSEFKNLNFSDKMIVTCLFFSISGFPPSSLFFSKFEFFYCLFASESYFSLTSVAIVSFISFYYYFELIHYIWFYPTFSSPIPKKYDVDKAYSEYLKNDSNLINETKTPGYIMQAFKFFDLVFSRYVYFIQVKFIDYSMRSYSGFIFNIFGMFNTKIISRALFMFLRITFCFMFYFSFFGFFITQIMYNNFIFYMNYYFTNFSYYKRSIGSVVSSDPHITATYNSSPNFSYVSNFNILFNDNLNFCSFLRQFPLESKFRYTLEPFFVSSFDFNLNTSEFLSYRNILQSFSCTSVSAPVGYNIFYPDTGWYILIIFFCINILFFLTIIAFFFDYFAYTVFNIYCKNNFINYNTIFKNIVILNEFFFVKKQKYSQSALIKNFIINEQVYVQSFVQKYTKSGVGKYYIFIPFWTKINKNTLNFDAL